MNNYSKEILEIHNEFNTASDKLLIEAKSILEKHNQEKDNKVKSLIKNGFSNVNEVKNFEHQIFLKENSERIAKLIENYRIEYPTYKFITKEDVVRICTKYNLVYGLTSLYKEFIPQKNLDEIEKFNAYYTTKNTYLFKINNVRIYESHAKYREKITKYLNLNDFYININKEKWNRLNNTWNSSNDIIRDVLTEDFCENNIIPKNEDTLWGYVDNSEIAKPTNQLYIAAPKKNFNMKDHIIKDKQIVKGKKLQMSLIKVVPKDPIVLKQVHGGYLVVTAWGPESKDPIVMNEQLN